MITERRSSLRAYLIVETAWDSTTVATVVNHIGILLGKEDRAREIISFIKKYQDIVDERVFGLKASDKPAVFFEWSRPYYSMGKGMLFHNLTVAAGGINIVADQPVKSPQMDAEWLAKRDPDIIVRYEYATANENLTANMIKTRNEILSRAALNEVKAIKNDRVYIFGNPVGSGIPDIPHFNFLN